MVNGEPNFRIWNTRTDRSPRAVHKEHTRTAGVVRLRLGRRSTSWPKLCPVLDERAISAEALSWFFAPQNRSAVTDNGQRNFNWAANKRFEIFKFKFEFRRARTVELFRARSRLYRSQNLQVNTRWKALAEIYKMHSFAPFWNRIPKTRKTMGRKEPPLHRSRGIRLHRSLSSNFCLEIAKKLHFSQMLLNLSKFH